VREWGNGEDAHSPALLRSDGVLPRRVLGSPCRWRPALPRRARRYAKTSRVWPIPPQRLARLEDPAQVHGCWWFLPWHRASLAVTQRKAWAWRRSAADRSLRTRPTRSWQPSAASPGRTPPDGTAAAGWRPFRTTSPNPTTSRASSARSTISAADARDGIAAPVVGLTDMFARLGDVSFRWCRDSDAWGERRAVAEEDFSTADARKCTQTSFVMAGRSQPSEAAWCND
jgi:hypothetical protein